MDGQVVGEHHHSYLGGYCEGPEVDRGGAFEGERHVDVALAGHVILVAYFYGWYFLGVSGVINWAAERLSRVEERLESSLSENADNHCC